MVNLWYAEAGANEGFPLDDRSALEILVSPRPQLSAPRDRYVYFPNHAEVPEAQAVVVRGRSFVIGALVDIPEPGAQGVLFAQGSRFGGHSLYVKDNRLHYVNSFVGMFEQKVVGDRGPADRREPHPVGLVREGRHGPAAGGHRHPLALPRRHQGRRGPDQAPARRLHDRRRGAAVGRDVGDPVTEDYPGERPYRFTGGTIKRVAVDVSGEPYIDLEREAALMLMRE